MSAVLEEETEIVRLPDRYEVIDGEIVEKPPMSALSAEVANRIHDELGAYARTSKQGRARMDMLFEIPLSADKTRNRSPDVAFISFDRWPENRPMPYRGNPVDVVPDLMVEVASPNDEAEDLLAKAFEYLEAGARLVWMVYPLLRVVYAFESRPNQRQFFENDELDGGAILPDFRVAMATLFPAIAE